MRPFELLLAVTVVLAMVPRTSRVSQTGVAVLLLPVGLAMALHGVIEGPRWQFVPVYVVGVAVIAWRLVVGMRPTIPQRRRRRWVLPTGIGVVLVCLPLAWALPVVRLPPPTGELGVGTTSWSLVDEGRDDPWLDGPRRLVAQAWYPTDATSGERAPWVTDAAAFSSALAGQVGLPPFALRHVDLTRQHALQDVGIAVGDWPVVVYSHGWTGFRTVQSTLMEELASHGFVVVSLDHTAAASVTLFPDGTAVPLEPDALPDEQRVGPTPYATASELLVRTFTADVRFLLDELAAGRAPAPVADVDVEAVGLLGHSTGGGAMVQLCILDDRCAGVVGYDPWVEPVPDDVLDLGLDVPLVSLRSGAWDGNDNDERLRAFHASTGASAGMFVIPGTTHADVTLQARLTPLAGLLGLRGDLDVDTVHDAVARLTLAQLDAVLRDGPGVGELPAVVERDG